MHYPQNPDTRKPVSNSDSFFGMALAQAFMGFCYGPVFDHVWDAGEIADAVYDDRAAPKKVTSGGNYQMGVKQSLAGDFTRSSLHHIVEPAYVPQMRRVSAPAFVI